MGHALAWEPLLKTGIASPELPVLVSIRDASGWPGCFAKRRNCPTAGFFRVDAVAARNGPVLSVSVGRDAFEGNSGGEMRRSRRGSARVPCSRYWPVPCCAGLGRQAGQPPDAAAVHAPQAALQDSVGMGLPVRSIAFDGVTADRLGPLADRVCREAGLPAQAGGRAKSLRQLYASGLYQGVEAEANAAGDGVAVVFRGEPRMFIGTVTVEGAKGATVSAQLQRASQLAARHAVQRGQAAPRP